MADVFYFSSPPRGAHRLPKYRASPKSRMKLSRMRRALKMDPSPQHACMARFDEPTFCSSDFSALLTQYAVPLPETPGAADQVPELSEDDGEDLGGVSLSPSETSGGIRLPSTYEQQTETLDSPAAPSRPPTVLGTHHPRPHSQELWDEEDSRRLRFALDGFDTAEVPRFLNDGANTPSDYDPPEQITAAPQQTAPRSQAMSIAAGQASANIHQQAPQPTSIQGHGQGRNLTMPDADFILLDDDRTAVDDPRRSYDFADFLDAWRLRSLSDRRFAPSFEPGTQPSIRLWRCPDAHMRSDIRSGALDMQAIRWRLIGPSRDDAATARVLLYPWRYQQGPVPIGFNTTEVTSTEESSYRFRSFMPAHRARTPHYQLRNVVAAIGRSDIFLANGSQVMRTSLACPTRQDTVLDLSRPTNGASNVRITCLATSPAQTSSNRFILTGGFYGEYSLLDLDRSSSNMHEGFVTHAYNGLVTHVHTYTGRRSGTPVAAFCSNDHKLRLLDTNTLRFTNSFTYGHAVNCSATSQDGRLRVLVSDCRDAAITDAEKGTTLVILQGHTDHGFACAWAPNGINVATGSEDGRALVWDARNWSHPLRSLPSIISCPRSLHFTDGGALVAAEDDDIVSIYQTGTFDKSQDVRSFGSIAGVALLNGGAELAVANADKTIGGLLTFERTAQGLNRGTFGETAPRGLCSSYGSQISMDSAMIPNVFV